MKYLVHTIVAGCVCWSGMMLPSCSGKNGVRETISYTTRNDSALALARDGDIILRCGKDELSKLFCRLNPRDQSYSHCGILSCTDSGQYVTHIIGGADNPGGSILYEPVLRFIRPEMNKHWALVRYDLDSTGRAILQRALQQYSARQVRFDAAFDLATDDRLYCSELVYKLLLQASGDTAYLRPDAGSSGKKYIPIDKLFGNLHSTTVCAISYK